ncbi:MAG: hypothetical protein HZA93_23650 [Verrucomicrobia bacterium]|nr:hypothetical protein [Verrucomicrobiota bacterium]
MTDSLDSLFVITCGKCGQPSPALAWSERPICGELPAGEFQCPRCGDAWRREKRADPWVNDERGFRYAPIALVPIASRL